MADSPAIVFECLPFDQLSLTQLYDIMALRQEIFVVEQNCPYLDADGKDQAAYHLLGWDQQGNLVAYARLLAPGTAYPDYASIGRVIIQASHRRGGLGGRLMQKAIHAARTAFDQARIKISAQCYLIEFYESLGFEPVGTSYLEDGIPHIGMVLNSRG